MGGPLKNGDTRGGKAEKVDDLLEAIFHTDEAKEQFGKFKVFSHWVEIVGEAIASQATPFKVRGSTLLVEVPNSVWMNELHLRTPMILGKIEKMFPESKIDSIRFFQEKEIGKKKRERLVVQDKRCLDVELDEKEVQEIVDVIDDIQDDELREAMWELYYHNAQYNKSGSKR